LGVTDGEIERVAEAYFGELGTFAYAGFRWANRELFDDALPTPLILWGLTPHGGCYGLTRVRQGQAPIVLLHPSLLGGREKLNPWHVPRSLLGPRFALDTLIHELMHVAQHHVHGGKKGPTSHDDPGWLAECRRLAPLLGLENAGTPEPNRPRRVRTEDGRSVVKRTCSGKLPFKAWAGFPRGVRRELGRMEYYRKPTLPWEE